MSDALNGHSVSEADPRLEAATTAAKAWMLDHGLDGYWYESLAADVLSAADKATPRLPDSSVAVDFGEQRPGSSNPMPPEVRAVYQERIEASVKLQEQGARKAREL